MSAPDGTPFRPTLADVMRIVVLPFAVCALLALFLSQTPWGGPGIPWDMAVGVSTLVGFIQLARRYGMHSVWMGLLYLPLMYAWLHVFSFTFTSFFFTDWP